MTKLLMNRSVVPADIAGSSFTFQFIISPTSLLLLLHTHKTQTETAVSFFEYNVDTWYMTYIYRRTPTNPVILLARVLPNHLSTVR